LSSGGTRFLGITLVYAFHFLHGNIKNNLQQLLNIFFLILGFSFSPAGTILLDMGIFRISAYFIF